MPVGATTTTLRSVSAMKRRISVDLPVPALPVRNTCPPSASRSSASPNSSVRTIPVISSARHCRQPRCAANAPTTAVTHHTAIAANASGAENSPIEEPSAVYTKARGIDPMNAPAAICHSGTPNAPNA